MKGELTITTRLRQSGIVQAPLKGHAKPLLHLVRARPDWGVIPPLPSRKARRTAFLGIEVRRNAPLPRTRRARHSACDSLYRGVDEEILKLLFPEGSTTANLRRLERFTLGDKEAA